MAEVLGNDEDRIFKVQDFFKKFCRKNNDASEMECIYCDYKFGLDFTRFTMHLSCIARRGAPACPEVPLIVKLVGRSLLSPFWEISSASTKSVSEVVQTALNIVAAELNDSAYVPDDDMPECFLENLTPDEGTVTFRGCIDLPFKAAQLLEKAIKEYPDLWPPGDPQSFSQQRYERLCSYLTFVLRHYGTILDADTDRALNEHVLDLLNESFDPESIYAIASKLRASHETIGLAQKFLMEHYKKFKEIVDSKREELQKLERQTKRLGAW